MSSPTSADTTSKSHTEAPSTTAKPGAQETGLIDEYTAKGSAYVKENPKYIIVGVCVGTFVLLVLFFVLYKYRNRNKELKDKAGKAELAAMVK